MLDLPDLWAFAPNILSDLFMVGLAGWLLVLDFNARANRAFALFLVFRALATTMAVLRNVPGLHASATLTALLGYVVIPVVPLLLYFASVYPRRRGWLGRHPRGGILTAVSILVLEALYFLDHGLLWSWAPAAGGTGAYSLAGGGLAYTDYGPLQLVYGLLFPSYGLVALAMAREYAHEERPTKSLLLVLAGFLLNALFDGPLRLIEAIQLVASGQAYPWWPWGWARAALPALTIVPALLAAATLLRHRHGKGTAVGKVVAAGAVAVASALAAYGLAVRASHADTSASDLQRIVTGLWRLVLPCLVTLALVRYQLFNIEFQIRLTLTAGFVVGVFSVAFFTVTQLATDAVGATWGRLIGFAASGAVALAGRPMQEALWRLTARIAPGAKRAVEMSRAEKVAFYRERYDLLMEDGSLSARERAMLDTLAVRLGLPRGDVAGLVGRRPSGA